VCVGALSFESFVFGVRAENPSARLISEPTTSLSVVINSDTANAGESATTMESYNSRKRTTQDRSSWKPRTSFTESIQSLFRRKGRKTFPVARKSNPETPTMLKIKHQHPHRVSAAPMLLLSRIVTNSDTSVLPVEPFGTRDEGLEHLKTSSNDAVHTPPSATRRITELPPLKLTHLQMNNSSERLESPSVTRDSNGGKSNKETEL
jgi:hypothetical protein